MAVSGHDISGESQDLASLEDFSAITTRKHASECKQVVSPPSPPRSFISTFLRDCMNEGQ